MKSGLVATYWQEALTEAASLPAENSIRPVIGFGSPSIPPQQSADDTEDSAAVAVDKPLGATTRAAAIAATSAARGAVMNMPRLVEGLKLRLFRDFTMGTLPFSVGCACAAQGLSSGASQVLERYASRRRGDAGAVEKAGRYHQAEFGGRFDGILDDADGCGSRARC